jgi:hypothetical protein
MRTSILLMALVPLLAPPLRATTVVSRTFHDLVVLSDLMAIADVAGVESYPTSDQRYAYTYVTLQNLEVLKGMYTAPILRLRFDGGPVSPERALVVEGIPELSVGERVVVSVRGNSRFACPLLGWEQGLQRVVMDPALGEVVLTSSGEPIVAVEDDDFVTLPDPLPPGDTAGTPDYGAIAPPSMDDRLTLAEMRQEVSRILAEAGSAAAPRDIVESAPIEVAPRPPREPVSAPAARRGPQDRRERP